MKVITLFDENMSYFPMDSNPFTRHQYNYGVLVCFHCLFTPAASSKVIISVIQNIAIKFNDGAAFFQRELVLVCGQWERLDNRCPGSILLSQVRQFMCFSKLSRCFNTD